MDTMDREITCCFTGHRPQKLPWGRDETAPACVRLKLLIADVLRVLYETGYRVFLCGMADGADMYFGEAVVALRDEHPDVRLEAVVPFEGQERPWPAAARRRYARLAEECDAVTVLHPEYAREHYLERDRRMVDRASVLLAVYDGGRGGTRYTIEYAQTRGVGVVELPIDP